MKFPTAVSLLVGLLLAWPLLGPLGASAAKLRATSRLRSRSRARARRGVHGHRRQQLWWPGQSKLLRPQAQPQLAQQQLLQQRAGQQVVLGQQQAGLLENQQQQQQQQQLQAQLQQLRQLQQLEAQQVQLQQQQQPQQQQEQEPQPQNASQFSPLPQQQQGSMPDDPLPQQVEVEPLLQDEQQQGPPGQQAAELEAEALMQLGTEGLESSCFAVPSTLCIEDDSGRNFVVERSYYPPDLLMWYTFDKSMPVDDGGQRRHLTDSKFGFSPMRAGPGANGHGASAAFDGRDYRTLRKTEALDTPAFTVMLWLFVRQDSVGSWRTIFSRGSEVGELLPALLLWPDERRLHVRVSPKADAGLGARLDSRGTLPLRRWTHVAIVCTGSVLRLYLNGVEDGNVVIEAPPAAHEGSILYLGRDPWRAGTKSFVDDFRWYSRAVATDEIRAMLYPGLTGTAAADLVTLACTSCRFPEAAQKCSSRQRHLCSMQELFSGALHSARATGWLTSSSEVWSSEDEGAERFDGRHKVGLCCQA